MLIYDQKVAETAMAKASEGINFPSMNNIDSEFPGVKAQQRLETLRWFVRPPEGLLVFTVLALNTELGKIRVGRGRTVLVCRDSYPLVAFQ
jgi:hypothetical protein